MTEYTPETFTLLALGVISFLLLFSMVAKYKYRSDKSQPKLSWLLEWFGDLSHEFAGAIIIGFILFFLVTSQLEQLDEQRVGAEVARLARSSDPAISQLAVARIKEELLYRTGVLANEDLSGIDLHGEVFTDYTLDGVIFLAPTNLTSAQFIGGTFKRANFTDASMEDIWISASTLKGAIFRSATMTSAYLWELDLCDTTFDEAVLIDANLQTSNLQRASLRGAKLQGAILLNANLEGADLTEATFNEQSMLPDGSLWSPGVDMARFTDSSHPDFWRVSSDKLPPCAEP